MCQEDDIHLNINTPSPLELKQMIETDPTFAEFVKRAPNPFKNCMDVTENGPVDKNSNK